MNKSKYVVEYGDVNPSRGAGTFWAIFAGSIIVACVFASLFM